MARHFKNDPARQEEMEQIAFDLGMHFTPVEEWGLRNRLSDFKLFSKGRSKRIFNLMEKEDAFLDEQFHVFDYHYSVRRNNAARRVSQTVFFIQSKKLGLPEFFMKPENFFHKIGAFLGMQDIDFEAHEEYSKNYLLQGADEPLIREMMHDRLLHYFTLEKGWCLEGVGYFLIFYKENVLLPPQLVRDFVKKGMEIYEMLKG